MPETENRNPHSLDIDIRSIGEVLSLMHAEDLQAITAVGSCLNDIERAVNHAVSTVQHGGRIVYIGAGTSGRIGILDAAEVYPTFGCHRFSGIVAGGEDALSSSVEGAEDDEAAGTESGLALSEKDMAVGISASGKTAFVLAALKAAKTAGAKCWLLTCSEIEAPRFLDGIISVLTGPEIIAGSTRLKAGTATKVILNMLSTVTMIRLGGVLDGLMVDVVPSNEKLIRRAEGIIMTIAGCTHEEAAESLRDSGMRPKVAALMRVRGIHRDSAEQYLREVGGSLRRAIAAAEPKI